MTWMERWKQKKTEDHIDQGIVVATAGTVASGLVAIPTAALALIERSPSMATFANFSSGVMHTLGMVDITLIAGRVLLHVWKLERTGEIHDRELAREGGVDDVVADIQQRGTRS